MRIPVVQDEAGPAAASAAGLRSEGCGADLAGFPSRNRDLARVTTTRRALVVCDLRAVRSPC